MKQPIHGPAPGPLCSRRGKKSSSTDKERSFGSNPWLCVASLALQDFNFVKNFFKDNVFVSFNCVPIDVLILKFRICPDFHVETVVAQLEQCFLRFIKQWLRALNSEGVQLVRKVMRKIISMLLWPTAGSYPQLGVSWYNDVPEYVPIKGRADLENLLNRFDDLVLGQRPHPQLSYGTQPPKIMHSLG